MSEVRIRFGWCETNHHDRCRASYTTQAGVFRECECPCHSGEEAA